MFVNLRRSAHQSNMTFNVTSDKTRDVTSDITCDTNALIEMIIQLTLYFSCMTLLHFYTTTSLLKMSSDEENALWALNLLNILNANYKRDRNYWVHPFWRENCRGRGS